VDSGSDGGHPALGDRLRGGVVVERGEHGLVLRGEPHTDVFGHGTACAGIIHSLAPEADLFSVRVLGPNLTAGGDAFVAGLRWAVDNRMDVINLSLSTRKQDYVLALHELADADYFQNTVLVASANNMPVHGYPWLFSSVISVASHVEKDPYTFYYNPNPPVEFTAPGVDLELAWTNGATVVGTGNSYATPHITGLVARILSKHRHLVPFQVKTVLYYTAKNVRQALQNEREELTGERGL
jgi:subtilisin family serine protease